MRQLFLPHVLEIASIMTGRRLVTRLPRCTPTLYLTFDDGPNVEETPPLLAALDRFDIKATFFVVGRAAEQHPHLTRAIAEAGHKIANHSMTHPWFNRISMQQQLAEIKSADRILERCDGRSRHPFRPPHGKWTVFALIACLLRSQKLVLWSHDSLDYRLSTGEVVDHLRLRPIKSGDIFLFHDSGPVAREALGELVPEWKAAGYGFSTIT